MYWILMSDNIHGWKLWESEAYDIEYVQKSLEYLKKLYVGWSFQIVTNITH